MGMKDVPLKSVESETMVVPKYGKNDNRVGKEVQQIMAIVNWPVYIKQFETVNRENLLGSISKLLLPTKNGINEAILKNYADAGSRESFIKTITIQLMSTPEYQLC
jgi:hypothetical protein